MDFSHSSVSVSGSLSGLGSELGDHRHRMPGLSSPGGIGILTVGDPYKQCRSASEMDLDERTRGPIKIARTDSFPCTNSRQQNTSSNNSNNNATNNNNNAIGSLLRSNSIMSDGRLANCSPTNSSANSDGGLMSNEGCVSVSEHRLMRSDSVVSAYGGGARTLSFHQPYHYKSAGFIGVEVEQLEGIDCHGWASIRVKTIVKGLPLTMTRESATHMGGMHAIVAGSRPPFTQSQWQELEHQALIFKYMMAGVSVPSDLIIPIRKSVAALSVALSAGSYHPNSKTMEILEIMANLYVVTNLDCKTWMAWGSFHLGFANNTDPEPGRCRRTDGKKWRCSRDVVPDQKYCERHMHRGRHRSRKPVEGQTGASSQSHLGGPTTTTTTTANLSSNGPSSVSLAAAARNSSSNLRPSISMNNQQQHNHSGSNNSALGMNSSLLLQIASGSASPLGSNKEYRYMNGGMKGGADNVDEQVFFSEVSGSSRGLGQDAMLSSVNNNGWRSSMPSKVSQVKATDQQNGSLLSYNSPQLRTLLAQDFGLMSETNQMNLPSHHQHSFRNTGFGVVESVNVGRESEGQGQHLRHFFDDWPRSRDASALSWSDVEEDRSNRSSSTTQLSISIPAMTSSDFSATNSSSPRGKLSLSPLKLSMSRDHEHEHKHDVGDDDDTLIGLGVGNIINEEERHRHTNWIPITWESPVGGPLAEVLQSTSECKNSSGLQTNLMSNIPDHGWECSPRDSLNNNNNNIASSSSPTGVLQKTFVSLSDSTSTGSSPRSAPPKSESAVILLT
eukprot:Gb_20400 [translate_table: standard]